MNKLKEQYDSLYSNTDIVFGGGKPLETVANIKKYLSQGAVLDVGGAGGRNALYLAEQGFEVTVYDLSEIGLEKVVQNAEVRYLSLQTIAGDIAIDGFTGVYNAIIFSAILHHVDTDDAIKVLKEAQEHTHIGGLNIIATFGNKGGLSERNRNKKRFYPSVELVASLYTDWDIKELYSEEIRTLAKGKDGAPMQNQFINLVAQKSK